MKRILIALLLSIALVHAGSFERAVEFVLAHEGGYCHDGGYASNFGISSRWYPNENMKKMTRERAIEIYRRDYWERTECDMVLDSNFALLIFDTAVLFGQPTAIIMKKDCWDASAFMEKRVTETAAIIKFDCNKSKYLRTWMLRLLDLQRACGL